MRATRHAATIVDALRDQGFTVTRTESNHWKAVPPKGTEGLCHFSDSGDPHAQKNTLKQLKAIGFIWPLPSKKEARALLANTSLSPEDEETFNHMFTSHSEHKSEILMATAAAHGLKLVTLSTETTAEDKMGIPYPQQTIPAAPPSSTQLVVSEEGLEPQMDRLYQELRSARILVELTQQECTATNDAMRAAVEAAQKAEQQHKSALEELEARREDFDAIMSGKPVPKRRGRPPSVLKRVLGEGK